MTDIDTVTVRMRSGVAYMISTRFQTVTLIDERMARAFCVNIDDFLAALERIKETEP